jgi:hypothetical protein
MPFHAQGREGFGNSDNPEGVAAKFFRRSILRPDGIVWGGTNAAKEIKRKQRVAFARTPLLSPAALYSAATLSCVFVSKSEAAWRS